MGHRCDLGGWDCFVGLTLHVVQKAHCCLHKTSNFEKKKKKEVTLILTLVVGNNVTEDKMVGHVTRTGEWEMGNVFRESEGKNYRLSKRRWEKENSKVGLKEVRRGLSDLSVSD